METVSFKHADVTVVMMAAGLTLMFFTRQTMKVLAKVLEHLQGFLQEDLLLLRSAVPEPDALRSAS